MIKIKIKIEIKVEIVIVADTQVMYRGTVSNKTFHHEYSDKFSIQVGIHQGSVFNLISFIIILQAIIEGFKAAYPENYYMPIASLQWWNL